MAEKDAPCPVVVSLSDGTATYTLAPHIQERLDHLEAIEEARRQIDKAYVVYDESVQDETWAKNCRKLDRLIRKGIEDNGKLER